MLPNRSLDSQSKKDFVLKKMLKMSDLLGWESCQEHFQLWLTDRNGSRDFIEKFQKILIALLDKHTARADYKKALGSEFCYEPRALRYNSTDLMSKFLDKHTEILEYLYLYISELEKIYDKFDQENVKPDCGKISSDQEYRAKARPIKEAANAKLKDLQSNHSQSTLSDTAKITLMLPAKEQKKENEYKSIEISSIKYLDFFIANKITDKQNYEPIKLSSILGEPKKETQDLKKCSIC